MKKEKLLVLLAYFSEILLSVLMTFAMFHFLSENVIGDIIGKGASEWANLLGVLFGASVAIWLTFVNLSSTEFGKFLHYKKVYSIFNWGFIFTSITYFIGMICFILTKGLTNSKPLTEITVFVLIYGFINLYTLIKNTSDLIKIYHEFSRTFDREIRKSSKLKNKG